MIEKQFNEQQARMISTGDMLGHIKTRDGFEVTIIAWDIDASDTAIDDTIDIAIEMAERLERRLKKGVRDEDD